MVAMFTRYLLSITIGFAVTNALFFVMHQLIEVSEAALTEPRGRTMLEFVRIPVDTEVNTRPDKIEEIDPPPDIPIIDPPIDTDNKDKVTVISPGLGEPPPIPTPKPGFYGADNALVNIIAVKPSYPASAASRGQEGWVIVEFDVNTAGPLKMQPFWNPVIVSLTTQQSKLRRDFDSKRVLLMALQSLHTG